MMSIIREIKETTSEYGNAVADFELLAELGRGAYGVVYKVRARKDNNVYALKKIPMKHMKIKHQREALQEMLLLKKLSHPNIIRYYASFIESENLYILMEFGAGGDLHALLKKLRGQKRYLAEKEIWRFAYEIALGLGYLHAHNIIHRDIKCLNIFLTEKRTIKIGDLGVSKIVASSAAMQGTRVGTPLYLSPELVKQQPYDFKVDVWAMGCVLYHIICLQPPFKGDNLIALGNSIVHQEPKPLPSIYSARLQNFILKLIAKKPYERPSVNGIIKQLQELLKKDPAVTLTATEEEPTLATNEGIVPKVQKPLKPDLPSPQAAHKKVLEQELVVSRSNAIKVVNQNAFQEHIRAGSLKPDVMVKVINQRSPARYSEKKIVKELMELREAKGEEIRNRAEASKPLEINEGNVANVVSKNPEPIIKTNKVVKTPENTNNPHNLEVPNEEKKSQPVSIKRDNSLKKPEHKLITVNSPILEEHRAKALPFPNRAGVVNRPLIFTYRSSQKDRPTLSIFRDISFGPEAVQDNARFASNRPASAVVREPTSFQGAVKKDPEEDLRFLGRDTESWQRPQSAMPVGRSTRLPALAKSICHR
eukprot:TRINITY_DN2889_c0_g4_i4.p1 TRINITY_DN2889_c0_g4~~TRINITY_DN2889_c0_g4_i4.p1  ORF type:complete len:592 (+),score=135.20 TRINITY_DN2889_c0_g4_i4:225-2000(+)